MPAKLDNDQETVRFFVRIPKRLHEEFKETCDREGTTMSENIRGFVETRVREPVRQANGR